MSKQKSIDKESEGRKPDYQGSGIAVWINQGKYGEYLSISIIGHNIINVPKYKEKEHDK